jgi:hypothetical protein
MNLPEETLPEGEPNQHSERIRAQHAETTRRVDEIEFLLGRQLTKGELLDSPPPSLRPSISRRRGVGL